MKKAFIFSSLLLVFLTACGDGKKSLDSATKRQSLNGDWEFKSEDGLEWIRATVPGSVHTDLINNKIVPDPYFRGNEDSVQWVSEKIWEYRKRFNANQMLQKYSQIELVFEGIDTHAEIFLNGEPLQVETASGKTDNMFRRWSFDVMNTLQNGDNELLIRFFPSVQYNNIEAEKLDYVLPDDRVFSRKAPYQFGWDWGPRLVTCGLWKPVYLQGWSYFKIENIQIVQNKLDDFSANMEVILEISAFEEKRFDLELILDEKTLIVEKDVFLKKGENFITKKFKIDNPELWHPTGLGDQKLYQITAKLSDGNHSASIQDKFGLRTISLVREKDETGESFEFHVNGKPVFMKGANYIPQDNFLHRLTPDRYEKLLISAKEANMNMLRVWGGGIYEEDYFYQLCDSLGILVWQDFIFAGALYPGDPAFMATVEQEAREQIKRLRNHPSIALWCGNNEVKNGWEDWGWQKQYTPEQRTEIWENNQAIFENLLPDLVAELSSGIPYHFTSPLWGWGHPECVTEGNSHYWGVWWGEEPFKVWEAKTGRFMAEYGFQSFPNYSTIETYTIPEDRYLVSPALNVHQKHGRGYFLIDRYMREDFPVPQQLFDYVYVSQLVQAHGVGRAIEIHRRRKPYCMGTLYWQLNDCWPVASWSSMDSDYQPKALHFTVKKAFEPVILTTFSDNEKIELYIVSDLQYALSGKVVIKWLDFYGNSLNNEEIAVEIPENSSVKFLTYPKNIFTGKEKSSLLSMNFHDDKGNACEKIHFFVSPKDLELPDHQIEFEATEIEDKIRLTFNSSVLVKNLYLFSENDKNCQFSDNYFDILPNETKTVIYKPNKGLDINQLINNLKMISLKDVK
ncbi:MAG: glycoside hydrolase family 2 protein [Bacteroidales bacterium]|nr:glycoside hydrolase family 2 protein [Bacteroidales bacterium]